MKRSTKRETKVRVLAGGELASVTGGATTGFGGLVAGAATAITNWPNKVSPTPSSSWPAVK